MVWVGHATYGETNECAAVHRAENGDDDDHY